MEQKERFIPSNVIQNNRFFGFKKRNLIEGVVWAVLFGLLINAIPFVVKVKLIIIIVVGIALIILNGIGIKGYAFSATVINFLAYRYYLKKFSYRRLSSDTEETRPIINDKNEVRTIKENRTTQAVRNILGR